MEFADLKSWDFLIWKAIYQVLRFTSFEPFLGDFTNQPNQKEKCLTFTHLLTSSFQTQRVYIDLYIFIPIWPSLKVTFV